MSTATVEGFTPFTLERPAQPQAQEASRSIFRSVINSEDPLIQAAPVMLDALLLSRSALQQCNLFSRSTTEEARIVALANYQDWFTAQGFSAMVRGGPRRSWRETTPIRDTDRVVCCAPYLHKSLTEFAGIPNIHLGARHMYSTQLEKALKDVLVWATGPRLLVCGMATGHVGWQQAAVQSMVITGRERSDLRTGLAAWLDVADPRMKASVRHLDYTGWYWRNHSGR